MQVTWYKFLWTLFQGRKSSEVQNLLQLFVSLVCIHSDSQVMFLMTDSFSFSPSDRSQLHLCLQTTPIGWKTSSLSTPCCNEHLRFSLSRNCVISRTCSAECSKRSYPRHFPAIPAFVQRVILLLWSPFVL